VLAPPSFSYSLFFSCKAVCYHYRRGGTVLYQSRRAERVDWGRGALEVPMIE
jgi:hypothetical protein